MPSDKLVGIEFKKKQTKQERIVTYTIRGTERSVPTMIRITIRFFKRSAGIRTAESRTCNNETLY